MKKELLIASTIILCSLCFIVGRVSKRGCEADFATKYDTTTIFKIDTCIVHDFDTIVENVVRYKQIAVHDTAFVFVNDTIKIPITQKWYHEDSLCDVWVSGYEPNLDSLHIVQRHTTEIVNHFREVTKMPRLMAEVGCGAFYLPNRLVCSVCTEVRYNAPKMSYSLGAAYTTDKKVVVGARVGLRFNLVK